MNITTITLPLGKACLFAATLFTGTMGYANDRTTLVLDASGSMWAQVGGKSRVEIARETLAGILKTLPAEREIGLVAYGHREKGNCNDIEVLVAPKSGTADEITQKVNALNALGKTPLTAAVKKAAESMQFTEDKATVVLITDGLETCDADPCALATELEKQGVDFTAHVVGFGLSDEEGRKIACLAENTGGKYLSASDASGLTDALAKTVEIAAKPASAPKPAAVEFNLKSTVSLSENETALPTIKDLPNVLWTVFNADQSEEIQRKYGEQLEIKLPAGDYYLQVKLGQANVGQAITLTDDQTATPHFALKAGVVKYNVVDGAGDTITPTTTVFYPEGEIQSYGGDTVVIPAGAIKIESTLTNSVVADEFALKAGEVLDKTLTFSFGRVNITLNYAESGPLFEDSADLQIYATKKALDGSREHLAGEYSNGKSSFDLAAGDYVLIAKKGNAEIEAVFTIEANAVTEKIVNLEVGVLAISAPGANRVDVYEAEKDLQGKRKHVEGAYQEDSSYTLKAGNYFIEVKLADSDKIIEKTVAITAGQREEVTVQQ